MKTIFKMLRYVKPYWLHALLNFLSNLISIFFSFLSLTMVVPYLNLMFSTNTSNKLPLKPHFALNEKALMDFVNYEMQNILAHHTKTEALMFICIAVLIAFFFKNLFRYSAIYFLATIRNGVVKDIRNQIYKKILILPISYFNEKRRGDIMSRMTNDVLEIEWSILSSLEQMLKDPLTVLFYIVALFIISPKLTIFALFLLPVSGILINRIGRSLKRTSVKAQAKLGIILSVIEETLAGLRIIKAFNAIDITDRKFKEINRDYTRTAVRLYRKRDLASPLSEFLGICVTVIIIWFGGKLVLSADHQLGPDTFILYIVVFSQIISPAKTFTTAFYNIQKGIASYDRIQQVLQAEEVIVEKQDAKQIKEFNYSIEYVNVSFKYASEPVLKNINLKINKGKTIAIVGHSGSGKSTLVDLLPRFYDCTNGEIRIDGIPIKDLIIDDVRRLSGIVSQQTILFNDSVYNNIAFGKLDVSEEKVKEAAQVANADEFIMDMAAEYDSNIGDSGCKLSGGQRQRISIARAVLKNPPILILDEATSSLDSESERLVQAALLNVMKNRTCIVIAHRLSTVIHADEIYVLNEGEIVEHGTHNELIKLSGYYKKLYDLQMFS